VRTAGRDSAAFGFREHGSPECAATPSAFPSTHPDARSTDVQRSSHGPTAPTNVDCSIDRVGFATPR
jgi:hypothetical protein